VPIINVSAFKRPAAPQSADTDRADGLEAFKTEAIATRTVPEPNRSHQRPSRRGIKIAGFVGLLTLLTGGGLALSGYRPPNVFAVTPEPASLSLRTTPAGADVTIDGVPQGVTPVSLTLAAGTYHVTLRTPDGQERSLDVALKSGESLVQQIEWAAVPAPVVAATGAMHIQTEPAGQTVVVDDVRRGLSPLTLTDLTPGEHQLVVTGNSGTFRRVVTITAGDTLSVVVAPHAPAVSAGFLRVSSPVLLQIKANGDLIGNTESARVMLPAGEHEIEMSSEALNFRRTQRVTIAAGRTADVNVTLPNGAISINAVPWADVWLNNERLGPTPLANLLRPIGTYRVTFRHPQLGERQTTVTVKDRETARVGMDMRQP
jgi:hypothetical protein